MLEVIFALFEYCGLPGILGERLFSVLDTNLDDYLDYSEFMTGLVRIYCSSFDEKIKFVFEMYFSIILVMISIMMEL